MVFRRVPTSTAIFAVSLIAMFVFGGACWETGLATAQTAAAPAAAAALENPAAVDPFTVALAASDLKPSDLGFRPKSYWARYPNAALIPYKPILFDDLFAEPTRLYDVVRIMALAASDYLDPRYRAPHAGPLYKLAYFIGFEKKVGGFRNYGHTQMAKVAEREPLVQAIRTAYERRGRNFDFFVMGKHADWPRLEDRVREAVTPLDPELRRVLARAVLELVEARRWVDVALRNVDMRDALRVWANRDLSETQFDGMEYFPEVDDVARAVDEPSLYHAGMRAIQAAERLKQDLEVLLARKKDGAAAVDWSRQRLDLETPLGRLVVGGAGPDTHDARDTFLLVDLGGDDTYHGPAGATSSMRVPVAVCLDMAGDDHYVNTDRLMPAQGAGVLGAGVLVDVAGDDRYESRSLSQGAGLFGTGLLADLAGNDHYSMEVAGQGAGLFGVGMLVDRDGADAYRLHGDGQGYGGVGGGVGSLVDAAGDDTYLAEPDANQVKRGDYHGGNEINYAYAQGVGIGRRGDISDGHAWAGGTGTLIDLAGNDSYTSGTWSLGCSYWYGIGFFYDGAGHDVYRSCSWSLASGAHFGVSAFFDEAGDDRYLGYRNASQNLGFGHDYVVALFVDRAGNDRYEVKTNSLGYAQRMSQAFFLDLAGNDVYARQADRKKAAARKAASKNTANQKPRARPPFHGLLGATDAHRRLERPRLEFTYEIYATQIGLFLDLDGEDTYQEEILEFGPDARPDGSFVSRWEKRSWNGQTRLRPPADDPRGRLRHHGIFVDREARQVPAIPWLADRFSSLHEK